MTTVAGCALLAAAFGYMVFGSIGVVFALGAGVYFWMGQNDDEEEKRRREKVQRIADEKQRREEVQRIADEKEARHRAWLAEEADLAAINATIRQELRMDLYGEELRKHYTRCTQHLHEIPFHCTQHGAGCGWRRARALHGPC